MRAPRKHGALGGSALNFANPKGRCVVERTGDVHDWVEARRNAGVWSFGRVLDSKPGPRATLRDEAGRSGEDDVLNFASQDYLGLTSDPRLRDVVAEAAERYGVHSAGSAILSGRMRFTVDIEERLAGLLNKETAILYPTGWAAGFGVLAGLVRRRDAVILDKLCHNCLQEGAAHVTENVFKFRHNDVGHLEEQLQAAREQAPDGALVVVTEGLFSMDADQPDLAETVRVARRYGATTIVDVAHDFGSMGDRGLGVLESCPPELWPEIVMGSFSKTFASNGGFVACSRSVKDHLSIFSPSFVFSNALSPIQLAVLETTTRIVFSAEGRRLRTQLMQAIRGLRDAMEEAGLRVGGVPSPIVPVYGRNMAHARLTMQAFAALGLNVNLVEFPAVPRDEPRFRFQVMARHTVEDVRAAARITVDALETPASDAVPA